MNVAARKETVYHLSPLRLWLVPGIFLIFPVFMFWLILGDPESGTPDTRRLAIYIGIFFVALAVVMYLILRYTRLMLSAEGVKLYQLGYKLETGWDNVAYLYDEGFGSQGLVLHRPMDCPGARTLSRARNVAVEGVNFYSDEQIQLIAERRFIPIDAFAYWLKHGRLRDDLNRRAPAPNPGVKQRSA